MSSIWQTGLAPVRDRAPWILGTAIGLVLFAMPAEAQVHVDVGIFTPRIGGHVVVGAPRVVYVDDRYYYPAYRRYDPYWRRDRGRSRGEREYYRDLRHARREYQRDVRDARRDYQRDLREARRDYRRDRRR
jgi:hypothetical protein